MTASRETSAKGRSRGLAVKRALDLIAAVLLLSLLSPVIAIAAALVWVTMGRPIVFRQLRPGLHGKPLMLLKFRTMRVRGDGGSVSLSDEQRITAVGRVLRSTSIDELPQLINVLRGELSLVGPRPLLMQYLPRYSREQARRHDVLPGITGWAQVNGRNAISWEEKFALDVWYVDNWSLGLDLKILARTAVRVFARSGISRAGHATMPEFVGVRGREEAQ